MSDNDLRDALAKAISETWRRFQARRDAGALLQSHASADDLADACIEVIKKWQADEPEKQE